MVNGMRLKRFAPVIFMVAMSICLVSVSAFGQDDAPIEAESTTTASGTKTAPAKRTTIDFEDELVEGKTKNPELFYLLQKRQFNYKRLIRLRENFLPEMRKTSEDIASRKGSGD